jgi:hypothetical protein
MMIQKFLPEGPTKSKMHYEVFRNKNSSDADFKLISEMYARVMSEDKVLCDRAQKNLNAGVFTSGQLHPHCEKAPLYFQASIREMVTAHHRREKVAGGEFWPAKHKLPGGEVVNEEDLEMCGGTACDSQDDTLVW